MQAWALFRGQWAVRLWKHAAATVTTVYDDIPAVLRVAAFGHIQQGSSSIHQPTVNLSALHVLRQQREQQIQRNEQLQRDNEILRLVMDHSERRFRAPEWAATISETRCHALFAPVVQAQARALQDHHALSLGPVNDLRTPNLQPQSTSAATLLEPQVAICSHSILPISSSCRDKAIRKGLLQWCAYIDVTTPPSHCKHTQNTLCARHTCRLRGHVG